MRAADDLSRRERQIMDVLYARAADGASAQQVVAALKNPPSRTAVRTFLRRLENRALLRHKKRGRAFLYQPTRRPLRVGTSALRRVLKTFFAGSLEKALAAHLTGPAAVLSGKEIKRLVALLRQAKKRRK